MVASLSQSGAAVKEISIEHPVLRNTPVHRNNMAVHLDRDSSVAICTTNANDGARIASLLGYAGVKSSDIFFFDPAQIPMVEAFAVVVCHRIDQPSSNVLLPLGSNVSRIIVLSDCAREETVVGFLDDGARHFFNIRETDRMLQARLEAALRQHRRVTLRAFSEGDIHFDVQRRKVSRANHPIELSPKEYEFAQHLFSRLDQVVRNSELMTSVWSLPADMDTRRIDTAACRVRKKLNLSPDCGWELKRVRRVGYRLSRVTRKLDHVS